MPINNYVGNTFVAFIDICGFKEMLKQEKMAWQALDRFYQLGYDILKTPLQANSLKVEGLFISDCGILFVRGDGSEQERLHIVLDAVRKINKKMLENDFMLVTSIAYGQFKYHERIEFQGIEKNLIYGNAYLSAYLDNANGRPSIQPGQCRIIAANLPQEITALLNKEQRMNLFNIVYEEDRRHYYFYWNVETPVEVEEFKKRYKDSYNLKYAGMVKALKGEGTIS